MLNFKIVLKNHQPRAPPDTGDVFTSQKPRPVSFADYAVR